MEMSLRILTVLLFVIWRIYWLVTEKKADMEKPKIEDKGGFFSDKKIKRYAIWALGGFAMLQVLGLPFFPLPASTTTERVGFALVVLGIGIAIVARYQLGTNWANAWEYQVKKKQELVTNGIYAYIRNPIYTGLVTAIIGAELVAQSYVFIIALFYFIIAYKQSKM